MSDVGSGCPIGPYDAFVEDHIVQNALRHLIFKTFLFYFTFKAILTENDQGQKNTNSYTGT